jgi:hypothetical protein
MYLMYYKIEIIFRNKRIFGISRERVMANPWC